MRVPVTRTLGQGESAVDTTDLSPGPSSQAYARRPSARISFSSVLKHRPSFVDRWRRTAGDEESGAASSPKSERPPIPSALQPPPEACATPLPTLSMIVLSIVGRFYCVVCAIGC